MAGHGLDAALRLRCFPRAEYFWDRWSAVGTGDTRAQPGHRPSKKQGRGTGLVFVGGVVLGAVKIPRSFVAVDLMWTCWVVQRRRSRDVSYRASLGI